MARRGPASGPGAVGLCHLSTLLCHIEGVTHALVAPPNGLGPGGMRPAHTPRPRRPRCLRSRHQPCYRSGRARHRARLSTYHSRFAKMQALPARVRWHAAQGRAGALAAPASCRYGKASFTQCYLLRESCQLVFALASQAPLDSCAPGSAAAAAGSGRCTAASIVPLRGRGTSRVRGGPRAQQVHAAAYAPAAAAWRGA